MVNTIKIFNSKDFPFGPLSINHEDNLYINNILYRSVANFIYSNMVNSSSISKFCKGF